MDVFKKFVVGLCVVLSLTSVVFAVSEFSDSLAFIHVKNIIIDGVYEALFYVPASTPSQNSLYFVNVTKRPAPDIVIYPSKTDVGRMDIVFLDTDGIYKVLGKGECRYVNGKYATYFNGRKMDFGNETHELIYTVSRHQASLK